MLTVPNLTISAQHLLDRDMLFDAKRHFICLDSISSGWIVRIYQVAFGG